MEGNAKSAASVCLCKVEETLEMALVYNSRFKRKTSVVENKE